MNESPNQLAILARSGRTAPDSNQSALSLTMLKGLQVLEYVASHSGSLAVGEVSAALNIEKSTTSRLLASLRSAGYVRQGQDRRYQLTSKLLFLTRNFIPAEHLREVAREAAVGLHGAFEETVHVAAIDKGEIVFVDFLESPLTVRIQLPTVPAPLHLTAIGRAMMARMTADHYQSALDESLIASGAPLGRAEIDELTSSVDQARKLGYAVYTKGDDVTRVAVAITNQTGTPVGGISVSGPSYRIGGQIAAIGQALKEALENVQG